MENKITVLTTTSSYNYSDFPDSINLVKNPRKRRLNEEEVINFIKEHNPVGLIAGVEPLTEKVLQEAVYLKVISRCGIDLYSIDLKAAKKLGIIVSGTHVAPDVPAAELAITMMLSLIRKIRQLDSLVRNNQWERRVTGLLYGKTVGIIGCGIRGTRLSSLLPSFGCQLLGYDPDVRRHEYCEMVKLDNLIRNSDVITLHIPLTQDSYHMIGKPEIEKMKDGVIIVNTSRCGLLDENALVEGLRSGKIGGVGLDVFEEEPYRGPLIDFPDNTILTPHVSSFAGTYRYDIEKEAMQNLIEGLKKQGVAL
jgi:D-3-phosphoglycerate dehydrogenase